MVQHATPPNGVQVVPGLSFDTGQHINMFRDTDAHFKWTNVNDVVILDISPSGDISLRGSTLVGVDSISFSDTKFPSPIHLIGQVPDDCGVGGVHTTIQIGPGTAGPTLEFIDSLPKSYAACGGVGPGSSGFIIYGRATTAPGQNNPISIFLSGNYDNGAGNQPAQLEIENKANWDGDGKPQLWFEIPSGIPVIKFRNLNAEGRVAINSNGQATTGIELTANVGGTYVPQLTIEDAAPGYVTFPQLTGVGTVVACLDANGKVVRGASNTAC